MVYKIEGTYDGKTSLKETLTDAPSNQGNGLLQCVVAPKDDGELPVVMYVNTANYDTVKVMQIPVED